MSVTSQILIVDMLQGDIPTELITGIIVLHAEKFVTQLIVAVITNLGQSVSTVTRGLHS
jgi:DNA excision repair protein ERCC-4